MANEPLSKPDEPGAGKTPPPKGEDGKGQSMLDPVRTWMMATLTIVFLLLYVGALFGLIPGAAKQDQQTLTRLESVIFVIIGYYFGRLPAQATEKTLKGEIARQTDKATEAEEKKSAAEQQSSALQEKVKNTRAVLASAAPEAEAPPKGLASHLGKSTPTTTDSWRQSVLAAVNVLES
ncbi:MAG: hypothetical protein SF066_01370 [Thermoanaerobaculia bacterium]|nr:hypothetical protein [Thermoanaerobaculia bacterium]